MNKIWGIEVLSVKEEVSKIICDYCLQLKEEVLKGCEINFSSEIKEKLNNLAKLTARARGIVMSEQISFKTEDGDTHHHYEVTDIQVEEPFRALKQLKKLAKCLAIVNQRKEVGEDEIAIVKRIVLSSMPVRRADVLKVFSEEMSFTAKTASELLGKNYKTVKRNFDELVALGVFDGEKGDNDHARIYTLKAEFLDIFCPPKLNPDTFDFTLQ